jgi:hypothetical protein
MFFVSSYAGNVYPEKSQSFEKEWWASSKEIAGGDIVFKPCCKSSHTRQDQSRGTSGCAGDTVSSRGKMRVASRLTEGATAFDRLFLGLKGVTFEPEKSLEVSMSNDRIGAREKRCRTVASRGAVVPPDATTLDADRCQSRSIAFSLISHSFPYYRSLFHVLYLPIVNFRISDHPLSEMWLLYALGPAVVGSLSFTLRRIRESWRRVI